VVRVAAAVLGLAAAGEALAAAGWVDFAAGGATITDARGRSRAAAKGDDVDPGDTLRTGAGGRVQIHFTDGAYVSLQPGSEFAVKDYNFEGRTDGSERGFFSLARGAMRAVTGLIGRVNRNRYQIATPTATIGIRGTGGRIEILGDGSTLIAGTSGIWTLSNAAGTIDVPAGVAGVAPSAPGQPPRQTDRQPSAGPAAAPAAPAQFAAADERTPTGGSASLCGTGALSACTTSTVTPPPAPPPVNPNPPLASGSPFLVAYSFGDSGASTPSGNNQGQNVTASATFDASGRMTGFSDIVTLPPAPFANFGGTHQEFGTAGGVMAWGRWTGSISGIDNQIGPGNTPIVLNPGANAGYHYVVGVPATLMPTAGSAVFNFIGATRPTGFDGAITPGTFSGTFTVNNWATGSISVSANLAFSTFGYNVTGTGSFTAGSPSFSGSVNATELATPPSTYSCSPCTCTFNGAFYGPGAKFAGYSYLLDTGTSGGKVSGAAAFGR